MAAVDRSAEWATWQGPAPLLSTTQDARQFGWTTAPARTENDQARMHGSGGWPPVKYRAETESEVAEEPGAMRSAQGWMRHLVRSPTRLKMKNPARISGRAAFCSFNFTNNLICGVASRPR